MSNLLVSIVLKNCGADEDKFIPLDNMKYEIYSVSTNEFPNVILMDDGNLLSSICSAICSRKDNAPNCIGFSSNIATDRTCTLYSEVGLMNRGTIGPAMNFIGKLYLR